MTINPLRVSRASDLNDDNVPRRVMLIGPPGSGKTYQIRTLPGKIFLYVFDSSCLASIKGAPNIDYAEFYPELLDINVKPLSSKKTADTLVKAKEPRTYEAFTEHFEAAENSDFFSSYDWIGIDSFTTFADAIMDRVLYLNGRLGKHPEQADWAAQMATFTSLWRSFVNKPQRIFATCHDEIIKDEGQSGKVLFQPVLTGKLRTRIPLLFTDILRAESDQRSGKKKFYLHTVGDPRHQYVRSSIGGDNPEIDVTIPRGKELTEPSKYGLGALLPAPPRGDKK